MAIHEHIVDGPKETKNGLQPKAVCGENVRELRAQVLPQPEEVKWQYIPWQTSGRRAGWRCSSCC